jgi:hypothetical protein
MSKQTLIEVKLLDKILNFFGGGSSNSTKEKFLDTIRKTDPQLARAFDGWEDDFLKLMTNTRKIYVKHGMDTTQLDKLVRQFKG